MEKEKWKVIKGYENSYRISNAGRIYSIYSKRCLSLNRRNKKGYSTINLRKENYSKGFLVHRVVAEHFIPNPQGLPQVNHKDFDKTNNYDSNLEWCTDEENKNHYLQRVRTLKNLTLKVRQVNTLIAGLKKINIDFNISVIQNPLSISVYQNIL